VKENQERCEKNARSCEMETLKNGQRAVYMRLRSFDILGIFQRENGGVALTSGLLVISGNRH